MQRRRSAAIPGSMTVALLPVARVVGVNHFVFDSHEGEELRVMSRSSRTTEARDAASRDESRSSNRGNGPTTQVIAPTTYDRP